MFVSSLERMVVQWTVLGMALASIPSGQAQENLAALSGYEQTFPAMGTSMTLTAFVSDQSQAEKAFSEARAEIDRLVQVLSDYEDDSELQKLNALAGSGQYVPVSDDLWHVLAAANRWNKASDGAFDASLGSLTRLWRKYRRKGAMPTATEIEAARQVSGWQHVTLETETQSVQVDQHGVLLDLGAIAKGYIVDCAFQSLQAHSIKQCMVKAGGDLRCGDAPLGRNGWRVAIAPMAERGPPLRVLSMSNAAIATSGDLWQFSIVAGVRRSHVLDPKTGIGIAGPLSVSAIAATAMEADAAATAISILGHQRGCELAERAANLEVLFTSQVARDEPIRYSVTTGFSR